jgi:hypothetical protein
MNYFPCGGQFTSHVPSGGLGIPGTSDSVRIRPADLAGRTARLCAEVIRNGENPRDRAWSTGASRTGLSLVGRHTWFGGAREMKATPLRGTTRAATPFLHRGHTLRAVCAHADASLRIQGVGMT